LYNGGAVDQSEGMGISPDLQKEGYALLYVSYPRSDLKIVTDQEEVVYQQQFGK
jgi:ferredoxin